MCEEFDCVSRPVAPFPAWPDQHPSLASTAIGAVGAVASSESRHVISAMLADVEALVDRSVADLCCRGKQSIEQHRQQQCITNERMFLTMERLRGQQRIQMNKNEHLMQTVVGLLQHFQVEPSSRRCFGDGAPLEAINSGDSSPAAKYLMRFADSSDLTVAAHLGATPQLQEATAISNAMPTGSVDTVHGSPGSHAAGNVNFPNVPAFPFSSTTGNAGSAVTLPSVPSFPFASTMHASTFVVPAFPFPSTVTASACGVQDLSAARNEEVSRRATPTRSTTAGPLSYGTLPRHRSTPLVL